VINQLSKKNTISARIELRLSSGSMELNENKSCIYCGHTDETLVLTTEGNVCCQTCRKSKGSMKSNDWLRSIRVSNPMLWNKLVDNHRLNSTPIANLIRSIRIEA
jgi:hypothetical protein